MTIPYPSVDDESGPILPPWYTLGWTAQLAAAGEGYIAAPPQPLSAMPFPHDQVFTILQQNYSDIDSNSKSGYLTFWPSDSFTISEDDSNWRVVKDWAGTQTWPTLSAGVGPWAFSMEQSGRIFIFLSQLVVKLYNPGNPSLVTDSGAPLTYHVIEHFTGGRQFDITFGSDTANGTFLSDCIIPGSVRPWHFDPVFPMGTPGFPTREELGLTACSSVPQQSHLSTEWVTVTVQSVANPTSDTVQVAIVPRGTTPGSGSWHSASWQGDTVPYIVQVLVGPSGTINLAPGSYDEWVAINASPENPVFKVGEILIT